MVKTPLEDWIALKIGLKDGLVFQKALEQYQLAQIRKTLILVKEKSLFYRNNFLALIPGK
jgi:phenylacetate-coenzyme A ligase PaaK-like adenylate-forming protein